MRTRLMELEYNKAVQLATSIIYKYNAYELIYNELVTKVTGIDPMSKPDYDKRESKYYLNLQGKPHQIDEGGVYVECIEDGVTRALHADNIRDYPETVEALTTNLLFKNKVLENNPNKSILLDAMLNPVDIEYMEKVPEGTILSYCRGYVADNEQTLINRLNRVMVNTLYKWGNPYYTFVDQYYTHLLMTELLSVMIVNILEYRFERRKNYGVDDNYLDYNTLNTFRIDKYIARLPIAIKRKLNKNLDYIKNNVGSNRLIELLVTEVFDKVKVPIYKLINKRSFDGHSTKNFLYLDPINKSVAFPRKEVDTGTVVEAIVNSQSILQHNFIDVMDLSEVIDREVKTSIDDDNELNFLTLGNVDFSSLTYTDRLELFLPNIIEYLYNSDTEFKYIDSKLNLLYKINSRDMLELILLIICIINNRDKVGGVINLNGVYKRNFDNVLPLVDRDDYNIRDTIKSLAPDDTITIKDKLLGLIRFSLITRVYRANTSNTALSAEIEYLYKHCFINRQIEIEEFDIDTLKEKFKKFGVTLNDVNYLDVLRNIVLAVTGLPLFKYDEYKDLIIDLSNLLDTLTSYNTTVLRLESDNNISIKTGTTGFIKDVNLIKIERAYFKCLEDNPSSVKSLVATKFNEFIRVTLDHIDFGITGNYYRLFGYNTINSNLLNTTIVALRTYSDKYLYKPLMKFTSTTYDVLHASIYNQTEASGYMSGKLLGTNFTDRDLNNTIVSRRYGPIGTYRGKGIVKASFGERLTYQLYPDEVSITGDLIANGILIATDSYRDVRNLQGDMYVASQTAIKMYRPRQSLNTYYEDIKANYRAIYNLDIEEVSDRRMFGTNFLIGDVDSLLPSVLASNYNLRDRYRSDGKQYVEPESLKAHIYDDSTEIVGTVISGNVYAVRDQMDDLEPEIIIQATEVKE